MAIKRNSSMIGVSNTAAAAPIATMGCDQQEDQQKLTNPMDMMKDTTTVDPTSTDTLRSIDSTATLSSHGSVDDDETDETDDSGDDTITAETAVPSDDDAAAAFDVESTPSNNDSCTNNDNNSSSKVRFSTLEIREYQMTMGDHPSVSSGVPLTIVWDHHAELICDIDVYEELRGDRRDRVELLMPASHRSTVCYSNAGFSRMEIRRRERDVTIARNQRRKTACAYYRQSSPPLCLGLQDALSLSWRATMNATIRKKVKQQEREYIQRAIQFDKKVNVNK